MRLRSASSETETVDFDFIDLFAGIGGFRQAFESIGGNCVFASEWDRYSVMTYEANYGHAPSGDITKIEARDIPAHNVLTAGFPCQPFSIAGVTKHNALGNEHGFLHATQGTLFFDVAKIIKEKRPTAFLLENVKNLVRHDRGRTFEIIIRTLEDDLGYTVYSKVIDARTLVPQNRQRVFIAGFRDPVDFEFPEMPDLKPKVRDILEDEVDEKYTLTDHLWRYLRDYAERHRAKGNGFGYGMVDLDGVTRTLSARYYKDGSEILIPQGEGLNPRRLTPRECARLMGYPEDFRIVCSDTRAYQQFGNSIVVPVARVLASSIVDALGKAPSKNRRRSVVPASQLQLHLV